MKLSENKNRATLSSPNLEQDLSNAAVDAEDVKGFDSLVSIRVTSYRARRHDPDGVSVKAVLDGIVRLGLLRDDSTKQVKEITFESKKSKEERTIIEIDDGL